MMRATSFSILRAHRSDLNAFNAQCRRVNDWLNELHQLMERSTVFTSIKFTNYLEAERLLFHHLPELRAACREARRLCQLEPQLSPLLAKSVNKLQTVWMAVEDRLAEFKPQRNLLTESTTYGERSFCDQGDRATSSESSEILMQTGHNSGLLRGHRHRQVNSHQPRSFVAASLNTESSNSSRFNSSRTVRTESCSSINRAATSTESTEEQMRQLTEAEKELQGLLAELASLRSALTASGESATNESKGEAVLRKAHIESLSLLSNWMASIRNRITLRTSELCRA
uniref:KASH domain-containing protein n=1 Tax=Macrostomum lignano TaxID=282301 RepID=A0A1I8J3I8_9PLAT